VTNLASSRSFLQPDKAQDIAKSDKAIMTMRAEAENMAQK